MTVISLTSFNVPQLRFFLSGSLRSKFTLIQSLRTLSQEVNLYHDAQGRERYTAACSGLLVRYNTAFKQIKNEFPTVESFMRKYWMDCPAALERIKENNPMEIKDDMKKNKLIADFVSCSYNVMDNLRLDIRAIDQIVPMVKELFGVMCRLTLLPSEFEGKSKMKAWIQQMEHMKASDQLNDDEVRQLLFDVESSYGAFNELLHVSST